MWFCVDDAAITCGAIEVVERGYMVDVGGITPMEQQVPHLQFRLRDMNDSGVMHLHSCVVSQVDRGFYLAYRVLRQPRAVGDPPHIADADKRLLDSDNLKTAWIYDRMLAPDESVIVSEASNQERPGVQSGVPSATANWNFSAITPPSP